jgi:integrase/recombinase XerD
LRFTEFADRDGAGHITIDLFLRWKKHYGSAKDPTWGSRLSTVRVFARWLQGFDPHTQVPPPGLISGKLRRPQPYIYSDVSHQLSVTVCGNTYAVLKISKCKTQC